MPTHVNRSVLNPKRRLDESVIMKDLVIHCICNIAGFAHRARRFTMTDNHIDEFVLHTLSTVLTKRQLVVEEVLPVLESCEAILNRAKNLYCWSCEAFSKPIENIHIAPILPDGINRAGLMAHCAALEAERNHDGHDAHYWKHVAISKLATLAHMGGAVSAELPYDLFEFIHRILFNIAGGLSVFELVALVQLIEKEQLRFINAALAGDTLVEVPSPMSAVRRMEILVINEPAPPPKGSYHTGFAG